MLLLVRDAVATGVDVAAARAASDLAVRALVVEAELAPKPGLVDPVTNGAHPDMDLPLLLRSAAALGDWHVGPSGVLMLDANEELRESHRHLSNLMGLYPTAVHIFG